MKYLQSIVIIVAVSGLGAILYAWSGIYNIAATQPHYQFTVSFIEMLRDRSIKVRSDILQTPNLNDAKLKETAFPHYHDMCRLCHGAPEYEPEEFARGLYPAPPSMISGGIQARRSAAEIYWILKHGIKMTGMPAFGPTHDEEDLLGLVALVRQMPQMNPEYYQQLVKTENSKNMKDLSGHGRDNQHR